MPPFSGVPGDRTGLCEPLWSNRLNCQSSKWCTYCKHKCAGSCISVHPGLPHQKRKREISDASKRQLSQASWNRTVLKFSSENQLNMHNYLSMLFWFSLDRTIWKKSRHYQFDWVCAAPVAYLGYGRHGTCHGRHFDGGAKIAWKKVKALFIVSWTSILRPIHSQTAKLHEHSPIPNRLICNKSGVLRQHYQALWQNCGIVK